jgi:maleylacetate reductase
VRVKFDHESWPQRVVFDSYAAADRVASEVGRLGGSRVMTIASEASGALTDPVLANLPTVVHHTEVVMHVPVEVADRARRVAVEHDVDVIVCVGGGSTTGLAKAVAMTTGLPIVAVPTTYAGSEATPVWGLTEAGRKTTGVDVRVLPRAVVYDASLTTSLPLELTVSSGLNAMAHCVDSMWAPGSDPINRAFALEGIAALGQSLPRVVEDGGDLEGREQLLYGSYLAAAAFASAGSGLHHKICHHLGGRYNLPHAQTHAVVLPHVLALNAPAVPALERRMADAFGSATALRGLWSLVDRVGAPTDLRRYGLTEDDLPEAVTAILPSVPASNPAPVDAGTLHRLLQNALEGTRP